FALDLDYFEYHTTAARSYSPRFVELFGPPRNSYDPIDLETADGRRFADCAASVQRVLEDTLVDMTRALHRETGLPDLCLGGGVALNAVANARILAESGVERGFVPPAPGEAGRALRSRPSRPPIAISSCHREARGWLASCRASSPCGPSGARSSPQSHTLTVRPGSRRSIATWRRGCTRSSRRTGVAAEFQCC